MRWARLVRRGLLLAALGTFLLSSSPRARADDDAALSPEEARRLAKLLEAASRKKEASEILPVLAEIGDRSDPSFAKPLVKLLDHGSSDVCLEAAEMLATQRTANEKEAQKLARSIWKDGFKSRHNVGRPLVRGRCLVAFASQAKEPLGNRDFRDVRQFWLDVIGDPHEENAPALKDVCRYVEITKDKRLCRLLAEEIDKPQCKDPNAPDNPPEEWWKRRHYLWVGVCAAVVDTLEKLTGQHFKSTAIARAWFQANEETFGFHWGD